MFMTRNTYTASFALFLVTLSIGLLMPFADAFATVTTVGGQAKQIATQVVVMPRFIAVICYVIGVFFAARSLLALKAFIEKADDNPITKFLALGSISALLIMLPYIIDVTMNTMNLQTSNITSTSQSFSETGE